MLPHKQTTERLEDGFFDRPTTRLNRFVRWKPYLPYKNSESRGSKDTSKRGYPISANRRRIDNLANHRGKYPISRPDSEHPGRRPGTVRDIIRLRRSDSIQGKRTL